MKLGIKRCRTTWRGKKDRSKCKSKLWKSRDFRK
jgi:hypothetical protein